MSTPYFKRHWVSLNVAMDQILFLNRGVNGFMRKLRRREREKRETVIREGEGEERESN